MRTDKFDSKKFIQTVLIRDTGQLLDKHFNYFTFVIIGQGIEVLGSFFDKKSFDARGQSQKRFKKAIKKLFGRQYRSRAKWLYENFRCSLTHQLTPSKIRLTSYQDNAKKEHHFKKINRKTILVADVLYQDFKSACEKLILKLDSPKNREIPKSKRTATRLEIRQTKSITLGN